MSNQARETQRDLAADSRWRSPFAVLQTNLRQIDADLDVDTTLDAIEDCGADTWLLNVGGIVSFYPTDLPFQTRNPLLGSRPSADLLGDAIAAAKPRNIKVIARFDMSKISARIARDHPDWLYRSPDDEPQVYDALYSTCPSGEYYQSRTLDVLDEILDRYDIDGIFFNWFNFNERDYDGVNHPPCHCAACHARFAEFSGGKELPRGFDSEAFLLWRRFVTSTLGALTAKIVDHVAARNRDVGVVLRRGAPVVYLEGNNAFRGMPGKDFWPYATGEAVSAHVSSRPDAAVMVNGVAFIDMPYRMGAEQPEHFAQYIVQAVARGGNPSAYFLGAPGRLPMQWSISLGRDVMRFWKRHAGLYRHLRSAADVALVRPGGHYGEPLEEFRGVYQALLERHVSFDVVPLDALATMAEEGGLDRYALVVLPDVGTLGDSRTAIDDFVRNGGKALLTGSSGVSEEGVVELSCGPALHALAPALAGAELRSTYVTDRQQPHAAHRYEPPIIPVFGRYQRFAWKPEVAKMGYLLPRAPFAPPEVAYGHTTSDDPDFVRSRLGTGEVVHVPWTIGRTFREFGKTDVRDHLIGIVRSMLTPSVEAELHEALELITAASEDRMVLHLINHTGVRRRSYGPHVPISGGRLRLIGRARDDLHVDALVSGVQLETHVTGDDCVVDLPTLELFEVITITNRG